MFWTVIEIQMTAGGAKACLTTIYDAYDDALAKLYTILAAAAKSEIPYHAACILSNGITVTDGKVFDRRTEV